MFRSRGSVTANLAPRLLASVNGSVFPPLLAFGLLDFLVSFRQTFYLSPAPGSFVAQYVCLRLSGVDPDLRSYGFWYWGFSHCRLYFGVFGRGLFFASLGSFLSCIYLVAVFSARALGVGFRPGVRPTVSTTLTTGWTGWRFFAALSYRCMLLFVPTASAFGLSDKRNII